MWIGSQSAGNDLSARGTLVHLKNFCDERKVRFPSHFSCLKPVFSQLSFGFDRLTN